MGARQKAFDLGVLAQTYAWIFVSDNPRVSQSRWSRDVESMASQLRPLLDFFDIGLTPKTPLQHAPRHEASSYAMTMLAEIKARLYTQQNHEDGDILAHIFTIAQIASLCFLNAGLRPDDRASAVEAIRSAAHRFGVPEQLLKRLRDEPSQAVIEELRSHICAPNPRLHLVPDPGTETEQP